MKRNEEELKQEINSIRKNIKKQEKQVENYCMELIKLKKGFAVGEIAVISPKKRYVISKIEIKFVDKEINVYGIPIFWVGKYDCEYHIKGRKISVTGTLGIVQKILTYKEKL